MKSVFRDVEVQRDAAKRNLLEAESQRQTLQDSIQETREILREAQETLERERAGKEEEWIRSRSVAGRWATDIETLTAKVHGLESGETISARVHARTHA